MHTCSERRAPQRTKSNTDTHLRNVAYDTAMLRRLAVVLAIGVLIAAFPATAHAGLAPGSKGKAVLALQKKLIRLKYLAIASRQWCGSRTPGCDGVPGLARADP